MNQIVSMNKINKATSKFEQEYGRKPDPEEIEEETNLSFYKITTTLSAVDRTVSLETPFKDEDSGCLIDILPDESIKDVDDNLLCSNLSRELENVLHKISPRESDIIRMSFGIGMPAMQYEEISSRFGITCERVRQIQHEALTNIRNNYSKVLKELV